MLRKSLRRRARPCCAQRFRPSPPTCRSKPRRPQTPLYTGYPYGTSGLFYGAYAEGGGESRQRSRRETRVTFKRIDCRPGRALRRRLRSD